MKLSNLVFSKELIARVKENWLTIAYRLTAQTDNELLMEFVNLSRTYNAETGLADDIANVVIKQTII